MNTKLQRFERLKNEIGWTCTKDGLVFNRWGRNIGYSKEGYMCSKVREDNKTVRVYLHQYIWFYFNNTIPDVIDHINGDRKDNRLENLRNVTLQQNQFNRKNTKGYYKVKTKFRAMIRSNKKAIHLGYFFTEEEAREAYLNAKKRLHRYD